MGQPNTMSNSSVQQNSNNKKKSSNYAKTLAEIKNSISQFERTEQGQNMGRPGSSASIGSAADFVNYMMSLGFDEVRTNTFFGFCLSPVIFYKMSLGFDEVNRNTFFGFCLIIVVET